MKVIFMGTPDIAASVLKRLASAHEVIAVYTQPPRPAGRKMQLQPSPVQQVAESLGIPVHAPLTLKTSEAQAEFAALNADVAVVCAYGLILPNAVLKAPKMGCINIHASLLPRWRGAAPIQRAIEAGDSETGITIMQMDSGLDTGDMLLRGIVSITPDMTAGELYDKLTQMGGDLILKTLSERPMPIPQPSEGVTYAEKIKKEEALIDWTLPANRIERLIRAFNPFPVAYFMNGEERIRVFRAEVEEDSSHSEPGTVLDDKLLIACGNGSALRLTVLQRAGKTKMPAKELLKGWTLPKGTKLCDIN
ncbi:MAG: methionyl-tRNA formyltransferase [Alphaproteobacteria bacterium]|nr:methionyl-tRNA formyltransferase [Alphaproteobacteria bacterium]